MNCWESFLTHVFQKQNILIDEQRVNDFNPLYELARDITLHDSHFRFQFTPDHRTTHT